MEAEQPTRNEQTPTAPRRSREDAFKDLLLKLSHNLADNDVDGLKFLDEIKLCKDEKKLSAIEVLQMLRERGKFSPNSCTNLYSMLTKINRHDLAALVKKYDDTYPPQSTETVSQESRPAGHAQRGRSSADESRVRSLLLYEQQRRRRR